MAVTARPSRKLGTARKGGIGVGSGAGARLGLDNEQGQDWDRIMSRGRIIIRQTQF